jgi:hypothetical protein
MLLVSTINTVTGSATKMEFKYSSPTAMAVGLGFNNKKIVLI